MKERRFVVIEKCSGKDYWYKSKIGETVEVQFKRTLDGRYISVCGSGRIDSCDCTEIPPELRDVRMHAIIPTGKWFKFKQDLGVASEFTGWLSCINSKAKYPEVIIEGKTDMSENCVYLNIGSASYPCDKRLLEEVSPPGINVESHYTNKSQKTKDMSGDNNQDAPMPSPEKPRSSKKPTPMLDKHGVNITDQAKAGELDPMVGREVEVDRIAQILSRRKKNNPVLIGEPGVGKSAIVEGLAQKIVTGEVPESLIGKEIISLDLASMVAGTKYRGQFEERMKAVMEEVESNPQYVMFIDEIHTLSGAGGSKGEQDMANILKPALARGKFNCIGATTLDEYRKSIESDGALERRFQKIIVDAPTPEETLLILNRLKPLYEEQHNVIYTDEALEACVKLTVRYINDRELPDKAIDALDESGAYMRVHGGTPEPDSLKELKDDIKRTQNSKEINIKAANFEDAAKDRDKEKRFKQQYEIARRKWKKSLGKSNVGRAIVERTVSMMANVPLEQISDDEGVSLLNLDSSLKSDVIGQDEVVDIITKAVKRNRAGLKDPNKPIGTFLFSGPTGVGKTHLCKMLAKRMFGSEDDMIRIDMGEYQEAFSVSSLTGPPPGYIGYDEGGQLTEAVRRRPYSIVVFDEIEKAHKDVFNTMLPLLDDGRLTDGSGRVVDFKNCIVIMTSNIGSKDLKDFGKGIGYTTSKKNNTNSIINKALNKKFPPEFINRIDKIAQFNSLNEGDIAKILTIELRGLKSRIKEIGYELKLTQKVKDFLCKEGFDPDFGARSLKRAIQDHLEDNIADEVIKDAGKGSVVFIDYKNEKVVVKIK
jgi:ATP-dependent Clp protease ATP-binding subunit ClpC